MFERLALQTDRQANEYLKKIESSGEASTIAGWTRRIAISYRTPGDDDDDDTEPATSEDDQDDPVTAQQAIKVFYLLNNLTHVKLESDDEFRAFESAIKRRGGNARRVLLGRTRTIKLVGGELRWDRACELLGDSTKLRELRIEGLYKARRPQPATEASEQGDDNDNDDVLIHVTRDENSTTSPILPFFDAQETLLESPLAQTSTIELPEPPSEFPSYLERPASPLPDPPRSIPSFPRFDQLSRLCLADPSLTDQHLLSIVGGVRNSLEAFSLVDASCFSRQGLIVALRNLRNLFELDLTNCTFTTTSTLTSTTNSTNNRRGPFASSSSFVVAEQEEDPTLVPLDPSLSIPDVRSGATDHLDPYSVPFNRSTLPITLLELRHPIDYLPLYCPFLQSFKLTCPPSLSTETTISPTALVSPLFFSKAVLKLPLQYLTIGVTENTRVGAAPVGGGGAGGRGLGMRFGAVRVGVDGAGNFRTFSKELLAEMIIDLRGRLEALAITKEYVLPSISRFSSSDIKLILSFVLDRMMWDEFDRNWLRDSCQRFGIVYTSEASPIPPAPIQR